MKKFIVCLTIVLLLITSCISVFASMPENPIYNKSKFNILNQNMTTGTYYRYYLEVYNWNQSDNNNSVSFSSAFNQYFFPHDTVSEGEIRTEYMERALRLEMHHVFDSYNFVSYNALYNFINNESILVYFDPSTLETVYLWFCDDLLSGSPLGSYGDVSYSIQAISNGQGYTSDNKVKQVYNLVASNSTNNVVCFEYRISSRNSNYSSYNYSLKKLDSTSFWIAPQNIIFANTPILNAFGGYNDSLFINYYYNSYLNNYSFAFTHSNFIINEDYEDDIGTSAVLYANKLPDKIDGYYIDFSYYTIGNVNSNFNWYRYCSLLEPFSLYQLSVSEEYYEFLGVNYSNINGNKYTLYNFRYYFTYSPSGNTFCEYGITFFNYLTTNYNNVPNSKGTNYYYFSFNQNETPDIPISDYLNFINESSAFLQQIMQRLYYIMPKELYSFLVLSLFLVVTLATVRLVIS